MTVKKLPKGIEINNYQHYWKNPTRYGHEFVFAYGPDHRSTKTFRVQVNHADRERGHNGRWQPRKPKRS